MVVLDADPLEGVDLITVPYYPCGDLHRLQQRLEKAVTAALEGGYRTADLYSAGTQKVGCSEMGNVLQDMLRCEATSSFLGLLTCTGIAGG